MQWRASGERRQSLGEVLVAVAGHQVVRLDLLPAGARQLVLERAGCEVRDLALVEESLRGDVPSARKQLRGQVEVRDVGDARDKRRTRVLPRHLAQDR